MKSLELLHITERILRWIDVSQNDYDKCWKIVESILVNHNIKHMNSTEIYNQLLIKLFERKDEYDFWLVVYQRRNYIMKYLIKSMQEVVQTSHNIIDIPLYVIEKGAQYLDDVYEHNPYHYFSEDFHEEVEKDLLVNWLKEIVCPKESYLLQRIYLDWVKKKDVAKELKIKPKQISYMLNKIKNKATTVFLNEY